ncbi:MAG: glycosyltransferase [Planctomycetaceae bacterium]|jgi:glycosyltransferase involved in cell wall biosynthesis|nr:glycosyltransferase [Planctomycetaceae bacterium]
MKPVIVFLAPVTSVLRIWSGFFNYLRLRGFHVHLCASPNSNFHEIAENEGVEYTEIPIDRGSKHPLKDIQTIKELIRLFRKIKPTIVVSTTAKGCVIGTIAAKFADVPIRVMTHWGVITDGHKPITRQFYWLMMKTASLLATAHTGCSDSVIRGSKKAKIAKDIYMMRHHVFTQGESEAGYVRIFSPSAKPLKEALVLRNKFKFPPNVPIIVNIGRITRYKGIFELIDAYKIVLESLPETRLIVVGPHDMIDPVPDALNWLNNHPQVIVTGGQWNLAPYYSIADLFICPSHREGNPIVVAEASAMGIPSVGFHVTGVCDAIADGITGTLVPFQESGTLADAIVDYLKNPIKRFEHGQNARRRVVENQLPEKVYAEHFQGYMDMLLHKGFSTPEPIGTIEPPPQIDFETDTLKLRIWQAAKQHLLHEESLDFVSKKFNADPVEVQKLVKSVYEIE